MNKVQKTFFRTVSRNLFHFLYFFSTQIIIYYNMLLKLIIINLSSFKNFHNKVQICGRQWGPRVFTKISSHATKNGRVCLSFGPLNVTLNCIILHYVILMVQGFSSSRDARVLIYNLRITGSEVDITISNSFLQCITYINIKYEQLR